MGGAGEKMSRGVGCTTARGAQPIRAPPNPLQVGVEGRGEAGAKLGEQGAVGTGEGFFGLGHGRVGCIEDSIVGTG